VTKAFPVQVGLFTLMLQKSRMPQMQGVKGEAAFTANF